MIVLVAASYGDTGSDHAALVDVDLLRAILQEVMVRGLHHDWLALSNPLSVSLVSSAISEVVKRRKRTRGQFGLSHPHLSVTRLRCAMIGVGLLPGGKMAASEDLAALLLDVEDEAAA